MLTITICTFHAHLEINCASSQALASQNAVEWIRIFIAVQCNHRLALALGLCSMASFIPVMTKQSP
jgi:hypothetical protein